MAIEPPKKVMILGVLAIKKYGCHSIMGNSLVAPRFSPF
jgi:hypothetical protein